MLAMADDRPRGHAAAGPGDQIVDDDELAAALAAELERIAPTGAVPVLRTSAVPFGPPAAPRGAAPIPPAISPEPPVPAARSSRRPAADAARPSPAAAPRNAAAAPGSERGPAATQAEDARPEVMAPRSARRAESRAPAVKVSPPGSAEPEQPLQEHHRHVETSRHGGRRAGQAPVVVPDDSAVPVPPRSARAQAFSTTGEHRVGVAAPGRRRAAQSVAEPPTTQPVRTVVPEMAAPDAGPLDDVAAPEPGVADVAPAAPDRADVTAVSPAAALDPVVADVAPAAADSADLAPASAVAPSAPAPGALQDPLHETGPLALPPTLYESWERSLRSIGRPRLPEEPGDDVAEHADEDAPTMALSRASLGPLPDLPIPAVPSREQEPSADAEPAPEPEPGPVAPVRRRRFRARSADPQVAVPAAPPALEPAPALIPALIPRDEEDDGVDEVDTGIHAVSAAATAAVPLPPMVEPASPVTGTITVAADGADAAERRAPLGGPSLLAMLLLWCGAFASPVLLLAGFGLATLGAGGAAAGAMVLGVAVAVPAAVRLVTAAETDRVGSPALAARLFGPRGGVVVAAVLLAARLLAAAIAILAVGDLAAGFVGRTGVGGASSAAASVAAMVIAGLGALVATVWARRITRVVLGILSAAALVGTLGLLTVMAPAVTVTVAAEPPPGSAVAAGATAFAVLGLVLAITAADTTRTAAGRVRGRGAALGVALSAVAGLVVLVLSLAVGRGAGVVGDPATAFADVLAGATPAAAAGPLAVLLLVAALPLPALLVSTAGETAAVLISAGRSSRLGAVAAGLLALALALVLLAGGMDAGTALGTLGPVLGVPAAVWTGVATLAPLRRAAVRSASAALTWAAAGAVVVGWLLVDGLLAAGEHSPVLDALGVARDGAWRGSPAIGLAAAFVLGILAAAIARIAGTGAAAPPASRLRSGGRQAVDSVEG